MSEEFQVKIDPRFCKGCALCVEFCPQDKLRIRRKPNKKGIQIAEVREEIECTGCMRCAVICPDAAVEITGVKQKVATRSGSR